MMCLVAQKVWEEYRKWKLDIGFECVIFQLVLIDTLLFMFVVFTRNCQDICLVDQKVQEKK